MALARLGGGIFQPHAPRRDWPPSPHRWRVFAPLCARSVMARGYLLRKFLEAYPNLQLKDDQRLFTHDQRMAIFRRDRGICQVRQKCVGLECSWDSWEADHNQIGRDKFRAT